MSEVKRSAAFRTASDSVYEERPVVRVDGGEEVALVNDLLAFPSEPAAAEVRGDHRSGGDVEAPLGKASGREPRFELTLRGVRIDCRPGHAVAPSGPSERAIASNPLRCASLGIAA